MDLDQIREQVANLNTRVKTLESRADALGNQGVGIDAFEDAFEAKFLAQETLLRNSQTVGNAAFKRTLTLTQSQHNPDDRGVLFVDQAIRVIQVLAGFVSGLIFVGVLIASYFLSAIGHYKFPKGILPLLSAICLAFCIASLVGGGSGRGKVAGDSGQVDPTKPSASARFGFSITGGLVGFVIGGLFGLLTEYLSS